MTKDLTRGTPWKLIVQFALPIMLGNLLQQLYNTADTIIVGNFEGQQALSSVGACTSLTILFTALALGFSIGAGVLISQYFGAGRMQELRRYAATSIVLMLAMGLVMSVIGLLSAELLLRGFLGTPESLLPQSVLYFRIYAAGLVFQFGYNIAAALLRALGDSRATLYFLLVSSVLNVVLDLLFVAVCGMGARTVMHIVERALPCPLVAQANVETPLLRRHLERIGMHVVQEMPVRAAGRFYLVLRAEPGQGERPMSEYEAYIGPALLRDHPAGTEDYLAWRLGVETRALEGLRTGRDAARLREAEQRVAFVRRAIEEGKK